MKIDHYESLGGDTCITQFQVILSHPRNWGSYSRTHPVNVNKYPKEKLSIRTILRRDKSDRWCQNFDTTSLLPFHNFPISNKSFKEDFRTKKELRATTDHTHFAGIATPARLCCKYRASTEKRRSSILLNVLLPTLYTDISR